MADFNPLIISWFEKNKIKEAFLGVGDYFIGNNIYRSCHDILLIVQEFLYWVKEKNNLNEMSIKLTNIICELLEEHFLIGLDLMSAYGINMKSTKIVLDLDFKKINIAAEKILSELNRKESETYKKVEEDIQKYKRFFPKYDLFHLINQIRKDIPMFLSNLV